MTRSATPALSGDLSLLAPEILVQMLSMGRVTGCLTFRRGSNACALYFRDGRVAYAHPVGGEASAKDDAAATPLRERVCDALSVALAWHEGSFTFERGVIAHEVEETLDSDPQDILLDCLSRIRTKGGGDEDHRVESN